MNIIQEPKDDVRDYMGFYNKRRFNEILEYKKT